MVVAQALLTIKSGVRLTTFLHPMGVVSKRDMAITKRMYSFPFLIYNPFSLIYICQARKSKFAPRAELELTIASFGAAHQAPALAPL